MDVDASAWSGEGEFTRQVIEAIQRLGSVRLLKVEDAKASRGDAAFSFISNELFVVFDVNETRATRRRFGLVPVSERIVEPVMKLSDLQAALTLDETVGEPDYADDGMLQYLKVERIIPPYQTRGYKLVELVRIYEAGVPRRET